MFKKFTQIFKITKRKKFVISSTALALGFVFVTLLEGVLRFVGIASLSVATALFFVWTLFEGLGKNATMLVLILPTFFTLGVGLFWFLLPSSIYSILPVLFLYGVGIYILNLTTNIYTVSAIRTIALVRAAKSVGFVLIIFTCFLLFDAVLSARLSIYVTFILVMVISFPLLLHGLWTSRLTTNLERKPVLFALIFSYCTGIISIAIYFWPVTVIAGSLFLTVIIYVLLGLGQAKLEGRLFRQTARDYLVVGISVFVVMFLSTHWRG